MDQCISLAGKPASCFAVHAQDAESLLHIYNMLPTLLNLLVIFNLSVVTEVIHCYLVSDWRTLCGGQWGNNQEAACNYRKEHPVYSDASGVSPH